MVTEERSRAIDLAIGQIEKQFGRGAIMRLGEQNKLEIEAIPTGSLALDIALGIGGVPRGRITEILRPGVVRQVDALPAHHRRGAEAGRPRRLHRR